jgi:hypothetical protein
MPAFLLSPARELRETRCGGPDLRAPRRPMRPASNTAAGRPPSLPPTTMREAWSAYPSPADEASLWYGLRKVAATYSSLAALCLLISLPSGGSSSSLVVEAVRLLHVAGADADASGCRSTDMICSKICLAYLRLLLNSVWPGWWRDTLFFIVTGWRRGQYDVQNSQGEAGGLSGALEQRAQLVCLEELRAAGAASMHSVSCTAVLTLEIDCQLSAASRQASASPASYLAGVCGIMRDAALSALILVIRAAGRKGSRKLSTILRIL